MINYYIYIIYSVIVVFGTVTILVNIVIVSLGSQVRVQEISRSMNRCKIRPPLSNFEDQILLAGGECMTKFHIAKEPLNKFDPFQKI